MPTSRPNSVGRGQHARKTFPAFAPRLEDRGADAITRTSHVASTSPGNGSTNEGRHHHRYAELRRCTGGEQPAKEKNSIVLNSGAATADLTGKACNANTISYTFDTYMLANAPARR